MVAGGSAGASAQSSFSLLIECSSALLSAVKPAGNTPTIRVRFLATPNRSNSTNPRQIPASVPPPPTATTSQSGEQPIWSTISKPIVLGPSHSYGLARRYVEVSYKPNSEQHSCTQSRASAASP